MMNKIDKLEKVVESEKNRIYSYLLKTVRNPEDAEDLTQEVFLAFYRRMHNIKKPAYRSYLFQTAYHKALNHIKKQKKNNEYNREDFDSLAAPLNEEENNLEQKNQLISAALAKLPPKYALLLELQFYQKLSYKEIADTLNLSVSAVDSRLVRAKKKLKKIISQDFPELLS
jgi:RNA polymerase sigma-70 factor (ECF subfamily)